VSARVRLRPATTGDIPLLRRWDAEPDVAAAGGEDDNYDWDYEIPRIVSWREFLVAEADGRPIGMVAIIDPAEEEWHYWGEIEPDLRALDIWIGEADARGAGHGTAMMRQAIDRCFATPAVKAVLIDPLARNTAARRFYERLGFRALGPRRFGADDCIVYRLERAEWERGRARR
jgi:aminoglycoside 6'-N-acetyltransferase